MLEIEKNLLSLENKKKAKVLSGFFKTGKGQYGEGDLFLGISVPLQRKIAKKHSNLCLRDVERLLHSKYHEFRLTGFLILIEKYSREKRKDIVDFYVNNLKFANNWDLVDLSSYKILGDFLLDKNKKFLYELARSENLWERRTSMISCLAFIRNNDFNDVLKIAELLLQDEHDLIHKAVGWMLREIGKRNLQVEERFLKKHYKQMPRTMLRYAIEKFPEEKRKYYLGK